MARIQALKKSIETFPTSPGVYLMKGEAEKILYIGKAKDLKKRVKSYFSKTAGENIKNQFLLKRLRSIDFILTNSEVEAFLLEASLIKKHHPRYNIRLKDDKAYPYIRCQIKHSFPRFEFCRRTYKDGALYFGPYTNSSLVRDMMDFINGCFQIRDCSDSFMKNRKRPCMTHQIGRCKAPCVDLISQKEYGEDLKKALAFLKGENRSFQKDLEIKMEKASQEERFEEAASLRDQLKAMGALWQKNTVIDSKEIHKDVLACFGDERGALIEILPIRHGRVVGHRSYFFPKVLIKEEVFFQDWLSSFLSQYYSENLIPDEIVLPLNLKKEIQDPFKEALEFLAEKKLKISSNLRGKNKQLMDMALENAKVQFKNQVERHENRREGLKEIQRKFNLGTLPYRIECYDVSHFQGSQSVASQVVFEEGLSKKSDYRRYKLKTVKGVDDFSSLKEVLKRRFQHTKFEDPDLLIVDGGKGQLRAALEILKELKKDHIALVGLAKARTQRDFQSEKLVRTEERFFQVHRQNPVVFRSSSLALPILVGLRDEAHRFAITFHRKLRDKEGLKSLLDDIKGLGDKRKQILWDHFKTIEKLAQASLEEVASLPSFHKKLASQVLEAVVKGGDV